MMITNSKLTIYHKSLDETTRLEKWTRFNYENAWFFGSRKAKINKGFENDNAVDIRLPYETNENLNISNFSIDDIIVGGNITLDIQTAKDLKDYPIYYITSINNNTFGINKHIHLRGK